MFTINSSNVRYMNCVWNRDESNDDFLAEFTEVEFATVRTRNGNQRVASEKEPSFPQNDLVVHVGLQNATWVFEQPSSFSWVFSSTHTLDQQNNKTIQWSKFEYPDQPPIPQELTRQPFCVEDPTQDVQVTFTPVRHYLVTSGKTSKIATQTLQAQVYCIPPSANFSTGSKVQFTLERADDFSSISVSKFQVHESEAKSVTESCLLS